GLRPDTPPTPHGTRKIPRPVRRFWLGMCASLGGEKHQVTHKRNSVGRQTTGGTAEKRCT
ncbi:hypothetical protein ACRW25_26780, partial [Escherichia coli]